MLLNGFDVDTASGTRQVELRVGDLPGLGLDVDLLVVSAFEGDVAPVAGTLLGRLQQAYGIRLDRLACALDLRQSPLKCWVSEAIDWVELQTLQAGDPPTDPPTTRFQRIAVVEGTVLDWQPDDLLPWSVALSARSKFWARRCPMVCCMTWPNCWSYSMSRRSLPSLWACTAGGWWSSLCNTAWLR